jgi:hypothetical protein
MSNLVKSTVDSEILRWLPVITFMFVGIFHSMILEPHQSEISLKSQIMSGLVYLFASILTAVAFRKIKTLLGKSLSLMLIAMYFFMITKVTLIS